MSAVLVMAEHGSWGALQYVARDNPRQATKSIHEAYRFDTVKLARATKQALRLERRYAARQLPEWFR